MSDLETGASAQAQPGPDPFFSDRGGQKPLLTKEEHETPGTHEFGGGFYAPNAPGDCISGNLSSAGQSDSFCREDHFHDILVKILDHDATDADFKNPKPGTMAINEFGASLWIRGTVIWFSVALTPHP